MRARALQSLKNQFSTDIKYRGRLYKWDTTILEKTKELGRFLLGRSVFLDFTNPAPTLARADGYVLRERIIDLSTKEAGKLGIGKSTLHSLRKRAANERPFKVYSKVRCRLI